MCDSSSASKTCRGKIMPILQHPRDHTQHTGSVCGVTRTALALQPLPRAWSVHGAYMAQERDAISWLVAHARAAAAASFAVYMVS